MYTPPEVSALEPTPWQEQRLIKGMELLWENGILMETGKGVGRGAGNSTLRAMLADAILRSDRHKPNYRVTPVPIEFGAGPYEPEEKS